MKKYLYTILILSALLSFGGFTCRAAAENKVIGYVLSTDIWARIDYELIPSFNINGNTAVIVEDLSLYGFDVIWDAGQKTLSVNRNLEKRYWPIDRRDGRFWNPSKVGMPILDIYQTDIKVYLDGVEIQAFNIGGRTVIYVDSLAKYGRLVWNGDKRIIDLWRTDNRFPYKLSAEERKATKQIGKEIYENGYMDAFLSAYELSDINRTGKVDYITYAYFSTPYENLCYCYALAAEDGKDDLGFDVDNAVDGQTAGQYLMFYIGVESASPELFNKIRFGVMQGQTYLEADLVEREGKLYGPDRNGLYAQEMYFQLRTRNAIDYTKPAKVVATPPSNMSLGETSIEVDFSKFK